MWKRESSEEASSPPQSHEYLEAQRSLLPSVQSSSPHMLLPPASAPVFLPSASAPKEPLNFSQVLTVRELDLVPNRNSSHSYENPMFLPPPPMFLPHAPLLYPLSSLKSWSRAESGRAQQFRSRESIFYPYKEEQILSSEEELFVDPMGRNSSCHLETLARHAIENKDCLSAIVTKCRIKPQNNPEYLSDSEKGRGHNPFNKALVDDFFKGEMPNWLPNDALMGNNKMQYYEMKESEVEEDKEWLHLYAELALLTLQGSELKTIQPVKPLELRKIVVSTKEDVEWKKKVKAENAIFYISFKNCCGRDYNVIARRTTDGIPEHFSLEVKCC
ncbi:Protein MS5 [Arabidopsis thaliana x Arabidopsis arenosa]|uniref:Protein MS5 n=1 Tax=Arabidopsis thaliana x Arabidopsis arenosa TaxID=1240361 RepID=A0A8T1XNX4_9BRAS|nr:Protein MS5 [Arabidopsis thaliana x Arabidopsis arenosa]